MAIDLNELQRKFEQLIDDENFVKDFEEWLTEKRKEEQKNLLIEIMDADEKDGLYDQELTVVGNHMKTETALSWFINNLPQRFQNAIKNECEKEIKEALDREKKQILDSRLSGVTMLRRKEVLKAISYYDNEYITKL